MKDTQIYRNGRTIKEAIDFAKQKSLVLKNGHLIRLFADVNFDYYLYKNEDIIYIGSYLNSEIDKEMKKIFKHKEIIFMLDKNGVKKMKLQKLFKKNTYII